MKNTQNNIRTKKGAASFYIVAFSTLILMVVATSFAMVAISEISRSSNDDLSQSAYDSALAGIEDAKIAYANYRKCKDSGATESDNTNGPTCPQIISWMENPDCDMVAHILGKMPAGESGEVVVGSKTNDGDVTNQAYTCVKIRTDLPDYNMMLTAQKNRQIVDLRSGNDDVNEVKKILVSWYLSKTDDNNANWSNFNNETTGAVFPDSTSIAIPPTVELQIVQTAKGFKMSDFEKAENGQTNRAILYLVPGEKTENLGDMDSLNTISREEVVKSNDRTKENTAHIIYCDPKTTSGYWCNAYIELPDPIGGGPRRNDTFSLSVSLPYQMPDTEFNIQLICEEGKICEYRNGAAEESKVNIDDETSTEKFVVLNNVQISIDSTGRANDLYRRVETILEPDDKTFDFNYSYSYYPLQVGEMGVKKDERVDYEGPFWFSPYKYNDGNEDEPPEYCGPEDERPECDPGAGNIGWY